MTKNYSDLKSICDFIRYATSCFNEFGLYYGHGTDNAWDEAVALVLHTLHLPHDINPRVLESRLTKPEREKLGQLIDLRIKKRIPVPYLTHVAWFAKLPFYVDERVLIPRSSIAELIENHFEPWIQPEEVHHILDLCTGSGCISIACAKAFRDAQVDASDISSEALAVAKINVIKHGVENEVTLYESDLFQNLAKKQYDIIISNPPYVCIEEIQALPIEYQHEPKGGLEAGEEGLEFIIRILREAHEYLQPKGILIVEVGNSETALMNRFPTVDFTWLEFEHGNTGVFLLTAEQLKSYHDVFVSSNMT